MSKQILIHSCGECPRNVGCCNTSFCYKTGHEILDANEIHEKCDLPDSQDQWQPIHGEPTEPGYYWWLPVCSSGKEHEPSHWNIVSWHPKDEQRQKSGTFVGPLLPPITALQEKQP